MEAIVLRHSSVVTMFLIVLHILYVASYPHWTTPYYDQSSYSPNNLQNDEANSLFNSYGVVDPQLIQNYCNCIDMGDCPAALSVFRRKPPIKQELDLVRIFTCGYDGFRPQICCNLFIEGMIYKRNRKQKRAHYSYGGYGDQGDSDRYPGYEVDDRTNHHFFWDNSAFPHWSHAPTEPNSYDGHDCWNSHEYEKSRRGTTRRPGRRTQASRLTPPPLTTTEPPTTVPTTTTTQATTVAPVTAAPVTVVTTRTLIETTPVAVTGIEAKRNLLSEQCGTRLESRIVGGQEAKLGDYPWMARLGYRRNTQTSTLFRCGGTLLNERYVLTAAHCVTNLPVGLEFVVVRLGELDERTDVDCAGNVCADPPQDFLPANISIHPSYNTPRLSNDIALVMISTPVQFSAYITPLCLPFEGSPEYVQNLTGTRAVVAGWGSTGAGLTTGSPTLRWVRLTILPTAQCIETYRSRFDITVSDQQLCTGGIENMDACEGDSGGPLFMETEGTRRAVLIGIVSFGPRRCGTAALPGVYTRVQSYLDWVLENINL